MTPVPTFAAQSLRLLGSTDLSSTRSAVMRVVHDPTSNVTMSLLLLALVTLVVLLVISLVLALAMPRRKRVVKIRRYAGTPEEIAAIKATAAERSTTRRTTQVRRPPSKPLLSTPVLIGFLLVLLVGTYAATTTDAYCAMTCHRGAPATIAAQKLDHASCSSCHERHVVTGFVGNGIGRLRMVVSQATSRTVGTAGTPVDSSACLHCHKALRHEVVVSASGVRMSHAEVMAAGQPCTACHPRMGHRAQSYTLSMSPCITCHDSRTASAECKTCHTADPLLARVSSESTQTIGSGDITYPAVRAANRNCAGCHDMKKSCDPCHGGIRMPHSPDFKKGGHAVNAAFERKVKCWRCHDPQVCAQGCHTSFGEDGRSAHGAAAKWRVEHSASDWDSGCECHRSRTQRDYPLCYRCHDRETRELLPQKP